MGLTGFSSVQSRNPIQRPRDSGGLHPSRELEVIRNPVFELFVPRLLTVTWCRWLINEAGDAGPLNCLELLSELISCSGAAPMRPGLPIGRGRWRLSELRSVGGKFLQTNSLLASGGDTNSGRTANTCLNLKEWTTLVTVSGRVSLRGRNLDQTQRLFPSFAKITSQSADSSERHSSVLSSALSVCQIQLSGPGTRLSFLLLGAFVSYTTASLSPRTDVLLEDGEPSES